LKDIHEGIHHPYNEISRKNVNNRKKLRELGEVNVKNETLVIQKT